MSIRYLFRCDCDKEAGFGHFSRCLNLARALRMAPFEARVAFWGNYNDFAKSALERYGVARLDSAAPEYDEAGAAAALSTCAEFDVLVVDSYRPNQAYVDALKDQAFKLVMFDDHHLLDLAGIDLVVCFRAGAERISYGAKQAALGLDYLIVKPELRPLRLDNLARPDWPIRNILLCMGGSEIRASVRSSLISAAGLPDIVVSYITEGGVPVEGAGTAIAVASRPDIESLYAKADFIISGGGLMKYESAYCGIPNASVSLTAVQDEDSRIMAARNLTLDLGPVDRFDAAAATAALADFTADPGACARQRAAFRQSMGSDGTGRLAALMQLL